MEKLKPCPFCGSEKVELLAGVGFSWVRCFGCGAQSGVVFTTKEDTIKAWNGWGRRTSFQNNSLRFATIMNKCVAKSK